MERKSEPHGLVFVKGMAMGAADIVPGVSGGTIALIVGIYAELIHSLKNLHPKLLLVLKNQGFKSFWHQCNGAFLASLFGGVIVSAVVFAHAIHFMLDHYALFVWTFFFALILGSTWLVQKHVSKWNFKLLMLLILGGVVAYSITGIVPVQMNVNAITVFLAGCIAISAMLLPGISGSFLLLMMGMYTPIIGAIKSFDVVILASFALGCLTGLLVFSRFLSWVLSRYYEATIAVLTGFMLGALPKVWPWQVVVEYTVNRHGETVPWIKENVLPSVYQAQTQEPAMTMQLVGLMIITIACVLALDHFGRQLKVDAKSQ